MAPWLAKMEALPTMRRKFNQPLNATCGQLLIPVAKFNFECIQEIFDSQLKSPKLLSPHTFFTFKHLINVGEAGNTTTRKLNKSIYFNFTLKFTVKYYKGLKELSLLRNA